MESANYLGDRSIDVLADNNRIKLVTGAIVAPPKHLHGLRTRPCGLETTFRYFRNRILRIRTDWERLDNKVGERAFSFFIRRRAPYLIVGHENRIGVRPRQRVAEEGQPSTE